MCKPYALFFGKFAIINIQAMEILHFLPEDITHTHSDLRNIIAINRNRDWDDDEDYDFQVTDALLA